MANWPSLLTFLHEEDTEWLFENSSEEKIKANTILLNKNEEFDSIYFVINGLLHIYSDPNSQPIELLGPGEIIGEISFLDEGKSSAIVKTAEDSILLKLSKNTLRKKINEDIHFAQRFYHSLASVIAKRLRQTVDDLAFIKYSQQINTELQHLPELSNLFSGLQNFKNTIAEISNQKNPEALTESIAIAKLQFQQLLTILATMDETNYLTTVGLRKTFGKQLQAELLPYIFLTEAALRAYLKPRGYAGDSQTIDLIYQNKGGGIPPVGPIIDGFFLEIPVCQAVRNRRQLLCDEIVSLVNSRDAATHIASFASGPATELFDAYQQLSDPSKLFATALDFDFQALAIVDERRNRLGLEKNIDLVNENLIYLALGKKKIYQKNLDLVYSIGLIDYFTDELVIRLIDYIYDCLKEGGKVILGNFHPRNPNRILMEDVLEWKLIHRTEENMNRLFQLSKFNKPCQKIIFEAANINMFAECIK